jgi:hypothetical protein
MNDSDITSKAECFDAQMFPWSQGDELIMCLSGTTQTIMVIGIMVFMWTTGMIFGSAVGR